MTSRDSQRAQRAYQRVNKRIEHEQADKYKSFALSFPALVHSCGLAQALAYAQAKSLGEFQDDLAFVINGNGSSFKTLAQQSREADLSDYRRLTYEVISGASWIKRYVEALFKDSDGENSDE